MFAKLDSEKRGDFALLLIGTFVFIIMFFINFRSQINLSLGTWKYPVIISTATPVGLDFRQGIYQPAQQIIAREPVVGVYPPFAYLIGLPFVLLMSEDQAYVVQVVLLYFFNILVIFLALDLATKFFYPDSSHFQKKTTLIGLFLLMLILQFSSYGFSFSLERGNIDIYAIFFALLGVWLLVTHPKTLIWQVICISIAAHLKIYPAMLFLLLFWKHSFKFVLPALIVNLLLLLTFGPQTMVSFIQSMLTFTNTTEHYSVINHSTSSFLFFSGIPTKSAGGIFLTFLPLVIWLVSALLLLPGGYTEEKALLAFMISVPLMNVIPSVSNDYKLVILVASLSMLLYFLSMEFIKVGSSKPIVLISCALILFFFIGISCALVDPIFQNKWPFIVLFQAILLISLPRSLKKSELIGFTDPLPSGS